MTEHAAPAQIQGSLPEGKAFKALIIVLSLAVPIPLLVLTTSSKGDPDPVRCAIGFPLYMFLARLGRDFTKAELTSRGGLARWLGWLASCAGTVALATVSAGGVWGQAVTALLAAILGYLIGRPDRQTPASNTVEAEGK